MRFWNTKKVYGDPKVGIGVAAFLNEDPRQCFALRCLVASFQAQTYGNWFMYVVHDGPMTKDTAVRDMVTQCQADPRVRFVETVERKKDFGHPHRQMALDKMTAKCDWVGLTNQDNYYAPVYLEWMLALGTRPKQPRDLIYCDYVGSHKLWRPLTTEPKRGRLDLGAFIARSALVKQVRFDRYTFDGDGVFINRLRARANGVEKVPATLMVHN